MRNRFRLVNLLAVLLAVAATPPAQCTVNASRLLKNDALPDNLNQRLNVAIVPGLCENEAAMSIFDAGGPVRVNEVGTVFGHRTATNGVSAIADVEIYDGATLQANGKYTLGPLVFKLSNTSSNLQLRTHSYNTYKLPTPVRVKSGRVVVGFRILRNLGSGNCLLGYDANLVTDAQNTCRAGINILDATNHGPVDPVTYRGFGVALCPRFFRGSWMIRACVTPEVAVTWSGNATPGGFVSLKYQAPGQSGDQLLGLVSGGTRTGIQTPWGKIPLDADPIFGCFLGGCRSIYLGNFATFNGNGEAFGTLAIPNLASLRNSGLTLYVGFVTFRMPALTPFKSISSPSPAIVIR